MALALTTAWLAICSWICIAISISISCVSTTTVCVCVRCVCVCWFLVPLNWLMFDALNHNDMQQTTTLLMLRLMLLPLPSYSSVFSNSFTYSCPASAFHLLPAVIAHFCSILFGVPPAKEFTLKQFASCCSYSVYACVCVCLVRICEGLRRQLQTAPKEQSRLCHSYSYSWITTIWMR